MEHLRPLLDNPRDTHMLFGVAEQLAQGLAPEAAIQALRLGRLTALRKPTGGVRGIVAGDIIRRITSRTIAQQLGEAVKTATSPFQYALSTRAGCECISLQALCEEDPDATIISIDGIGAFDLVSRGAMLQGLLDVSPPAVPFVRQFYGTPSRYLWEDAEGLVHDIDQGEGGEQGDPMMPLLFSLGQHPALCAVQRQLQRDELIFAFLADIYVKTSPARVSQMYVILQQELWRHARIRVHDGKTQVWNSSGNRPEGCDTLDRAARAIDPNFTTVWRGSGTVLAEQGIRILGTPLGHEEHVRRHLNHTIDVHTELLQRIPSLPDVQSAWAILLHCANARANYSLRVVRPELAMEFARAHDAGLWRCLCAILGMAPDVCDALTKETATLPLSMGGVGLRSAVRTSVPAFWASWADSISMIQERHPAVAGMIIEALELGPQTPTLAAVAESAAEVAGVQGFEPPSWRELAHGARPPLREPDENEPGGMRRGWQHEAASHRELEIFPRLTDSEKASVRSQSGPGAAAALSAVPSSEVFRISSHLFRVLLLRRLRLPLPPVSRTCRCGRPLDSHGHHRAGCSRAGVLGRRGFAVESVGARICREAGARVSTNVFVRDLDLAVPNVHDARRLEIIAEGLPLFGGAQLAIDTTLVSAHHCDGSARRGGAAMDGAALVAARRRKETTYPELVGPRGRAKLVVLAIEVGGRWSQETATFLRLLAAAKAGTSAPFSGNALSRRGSCAGQACWRVQSLELLRVPSSSNVATEVLMGRPLRSLTCCLRAALQDWVSRVIFALGTLLELTV